MNELDIIVKVIDTLSKNAKCKDRYAYELDNFRNRMRTAESNKYRIGVIGVTSSGKSTMINSLLGESLLPALARPSSSQLVSCFHSTDRTAKVYFQDGRVKEYSGNSLNQSLLKKYGDEGVNSKNKEKVKQIELSTPGFPFDDNILLIDSPGLDAYGYAEHEQLTIDSLLPTIDFCIFVTTCKTNSDEKMLNVLNIVAEHDKPVIIVQNMIDSLKPSLDGKKSVTDVAQDHRVRVERIINSSNIKDKSKVHIVQISAINALNARQNRLEGSECRNLLELSNYNTLVRTINTAFNQVRPVIEGHRMCFLRKEILRIAKSAKEDGAGAQDIVTTFQYERTENEFRAKKNISIENLKQEIKNLNTSLSSFKNKCNFTEDEISTIKNDVYICEKGICDQMRSLNKSIVFICDKLNIDSRNIVTDFRFDKPEFHLKMKTEVVKRGYLKKGERHWYTLWLAKDDDEWIDTSYEKKVIDVSASMQNFINYINNSIKVFNHAITRWQKSIEITENKLYAEIKNRRSEHEAKINQILDCRIYQQIGTELTQIADSIKTINENQTRVNTTRTDVKESQIFDVSIKKELLPMYRLSERIRIKIQNDTFKLFVGDKNKHLVIGWDEYCEAKFMRYAFNIEVNPNTFVKGNNILGNLVYLIHKPQFSEQNIEISNKTIYILVNATQIGAALNEISRFKWLNMLNENNRLYFVIQDFNEIINGESVSETLYNMVDMKRRLNISNAKVKYLLLHDNPLYNLAAAEAQAIRCTTQSDEIKILNDLQKSFNCLLPRDKSMRNKVEAIIQIIIQKLGTV